MEATHTVKKARLNKKILKRNNNNKTLMQPNDPTVHTQPPASSAPDALTVAGGVVVALLIAFYALLIVYLAFVLYDMSQIALFFLAIIGSCFAPIIVPVVLIILLSRGVITESVRTIVR
jgi:hypothetical protein